MIRRLLSTLPLLATALCAQELPTARPEAVGFSSRTLAQVDAVVQEHIREKSIAGAVTIIARKGKVVHFRAAGIRSADKPMRKDTIFRIYSMSKPVTTVAAMTLVEAGKLKLDVSVSRYLPRLKGLKVHGATQPPAREMTVRDLMRHTSGFTYGFYGNTEVDRLVRAANLLDRDETLDQMVGKLAKLPLLYAPGTKWNYGLSVDVLGRIVEVLSGQSLKDFLQARIFDPLEMVDTGFSVPADKLDRFAANYGAGLQVIDDPEKSRFAKPATFYSGGGGLVSTASDYMRFCLMLQEGGTLHGKRILKPETVAEMTKNQLDQELLPISMGPIPMQGIGFGLGFSVRVSAVPGSHVGEYGWAGAASTTFWISPKDQLIVISMIQRMPFSFQLDADLRPIIYRALRVPSGG